ncbi:MAG: ribonuclease III [Bacteroidota bacterium]
MGSLFSLPEEITSSRLFHSALTHRSAGQDNNERLEFLGDAVLGFVIASKLFEKFPNYDEGDLSRLRAHLVCKKALARLAKDADLGSSLKLGSGEKRSGGHYRSSILADSLEAIIGAIYLLKGFDYTAQFISELYIKQFDQLPQADELKDPKTRLQEYLQSQQINVPAYSVLDEWGEGNDKHFKVECFIRSLSKKTFGEEKSKKKAEQIAAYEMIQLLQTQ